MTFDTEKLIREIESRKAIWDKSSEEYNDRDLKRRRWEEVTNIMCEENNLTENEKNEYGKSLQQKWKNIRTSFSRELKRRSGTKSGSAASRKSPYVYFEQLQQFLREIVVNNATQASIDITDSDESNNESHKVQICLPITKKAKKTNDDGLIEVLKQSISISEDREKKQELIQSDSDRLFLLSLLGDFKKIPEYQKLSTKIELMHIIKRAQMLTLEIPNQGYSYYMSETSASDPCRPEALNSGQYFHGYSALTNYRPGASSIEQNRVYSTPVSNKQNTKMIFNEELSSTDSNVTTVTEHSDILDLFNT